MARTASAGRNDPESARRRDTLLARCPRRLRRRGRPGTQRGRPAPSARERAPRTRRPTLLEPAARGPARRGGSPPSRADYTSAVVQGVHARLYERRPARGPFPCAYTVRTGGETRVVIREELDRLLAVEERHRRLLARLLIAVGLTVAVAVAGSILIYVFESGKKGGDVHGFGDAVFFTLVQLLTVSSSLSNPVTAAGKVVDVVLEAWAILVVTAVAGSSASFFTSADSS